MCFIVNGYRYNKEKRFEDILELYPYLIDTNLIGGKIKRQYPITLTDGSIRYIDLIYFKKKEIAVIELKRDVIKKKYISQLSEYVNHIKKLFPEQIIQGYLIGQEINEELLQFLNLRGFGYKELFIDIPMHIKICSNCRKAVDKRKNKCNWCQNENFIKKGL